MNKNVFDNIKDILFFQYEIQYLDEVTKELSRYYRNYGYNLTHLAQIKDILNKIKAGTYEYAEISDIITVTFEDLSIKKYNLKNKDHLNELNKIIDLLIEHIMLLTS